MKGSIWELTPAGEPPGHPPAGSLILFDRVRARFTFSVDRTANENAFQRQTTAAIRIA
jgi:hypothetical protein